MSSSDWEEVKRLAADFQRAQLATSVQRLSERNCVELINKLRQLEILKLYYTSDGKCYLTTEQLHREILDELFVAGGRINLVDISSTLCVDLSIIEEEVSKLLRSHHDLKLLLGQIISHDYEVLLVEEINEKLLKDGTVSVEDLAAEYELPGDFIRKLVESRLGSIIKAVQDSSNPGCFYTEQYLSRLRSRIRGLLTAVTVPTPIHKLTQLHNFNEKLFMSNVERLLSSGRVSGELSGNRQSRACTFVPAIHSRTQNTWVDNFLKQNGYLEYEFLRRLGIEDPAGYVSRRYNSSHELLLLPTVCVGSGLLNQLHTAIDEAIVTHSFVDISLIVPSGFSADVTGRLVEHTLQQRQSNNSSGKQAGKGKKALSAASSSGSAGVLVLDDTCVLSEVLVLGIKDKLQAMMTERGHKLVAAGGYKPKAAAASKLRMDDNEQGGGSKKDDRRRKAAGGKTGGGTQGRETKTRSTKTKKGRGRVQDDSDDDDHQQLQHGGSQGQGHDSSGRLHFPEVEFLPVEELAAELSRLPELADADDDIKQALAAELHAWSRKVFATICETSYHSLVSAGGSSKKKSFQQLQERVLGLLTTCRLAERGTKEFGEDLEQQLSRHLLRTQGSELLAELLLYLSDDLSQQDTAAKELTPETRLSVISQLRPAAEGGCREVFQAAHRAASGSDLAAFFLAAEEAVHEAGILIPKKKDSKKERQILSSHRAGLLEQLSACCEPALCLHLATLLLFHAVTGHLLHASGKFVPHLLAFLKPSLDQDLYDLLHEYQGLVMQKLTSASGGDEAALGALNARLEELTPLLQEKTITCKKTAPPLAT